MRLLLHAALVASGSAVGGLTRWGLQALAVRLLGESWPYGTFFINVTGCLVLGWLAAFVGQRIKVEGVRELYLLVGVGFCGAYTTFSTFGVESDKLLRAGSFTASSLYVILSVACGLLAVRLGVYLGGGV